jgi:DNA invertase Pin-like site-specific DNA recombinase
MLNLTFTSEDSPMAHLMLSVMGAFAEFERALIRERQRAAAGEQKAALAREFGISRETLYQYLRTDD